nr:MAG TPA: hypothetical protein [Caudoviricetes sp.]
MQAFAYSVHTMLAAKSPAMRSCRSRLFFGARSTGTRNSFSAPSGSQLSRMARLLSVLGQPLPFAVMATSRLCIPSSSVRFSILFSRSAPTPKHWCSAMMMHHRVISAVPSRVRSISCRMGFFLRGITFTASSPPSSTVHAASSSYPASFPCPQLQPPAPCIRRFPCWPGFASPVFPAPLPSSPDTLPTSFALHLPLPLHQLAQKCCLFVLISPLCHFLFPQHFQQHLPHLLAERLRARLLVFLRDVPVQIIQQKAHCTHQRRRCDVFLFAMIRFHFRPENSVVLPRDRDFDRTFHFSAPFLFSRFPVCICPRKNHCLAVCQPVADLLHRCVLHVWRHLVHGHQRRAGVLFQLVAVVVHPLRKLRFVLCRHPYSAFRFPACTVFFWLRCTRRFSRSSRSFAAKCSRKNASAISVRITAALIASPEIGAPTSVLPSSPMAVIIPPKSDTALSHAHTPDLIFILQNLLPCVKFVVIVALSDRCHPEPAGVRCTGDLLAINSRAMFWFEGHVPSTASVKVIFTCSFFIVKPPILWYHRGDDFAKLSLHQRLAGVRCTGGLFVCTVRPAPFFFPCFKGLPVLRDGIKVCQQVQKHVCLPLFQQRHGFFSSHRFHHLQSGLKVWHRHSSPASSSARFHSPQMVSHTGFAKPISSSSRAAISTAVPTMPLM